ncbi:hypothetical protein HHI36_020308 [Cryptolaemus montrouzieri]|uniref:Uncharacterized protein n=1 Tax=Cryptolaemus montrouzieri TaxID=559131 RepID=A0ABD2NAI6_9CUCU
MMPISQKNLINERNKIKFVERLRKTNWDLAVCKDEEKFQGKLYLMIQRAFDDSFPKIRIKKKLNEKVNCANFEESLVLRKTLAVAEVIHRVRKDGSSINLLRI